MQLDADGAFVAVNDFCDLVVGFFVDVHGVTFRFSDGYFKWLRDVDVG